jgi:hypothetical protein
VRAPALPVAAVTFSVRADAEATLSGTSLDAGGSLRFQVAGVEGVDYVIESTADFRDWIPVSTNHGGPFEFVAEGVGSGTSRFYRVLVKP